VTTLYLHGFCASPKSNKAELLRRAHEERGLEFIAPSLHAGPRKAIEIIRNSIKGVPCSRLVVLGSSLGGYYATWVAEQLDVPAVLINPAVYPQKVISANLGFHRVPDTDITLEVRPEHIRELDEISVRTLRHPEKYLTVLGDADEILDWTEARDFYAATNEWIIPGENHRLANFPAYLPRIMEFIEQHS
jgi:hypothetical protein